MLPSPPTQPMTFYWAWCQYWGFPDLPLSYLHPELQFSRPCVCVTPIPKSFVRCVLWSLQGDHLAIEFIYALVLPCRGRFARAIWKFHRTDLNHMELAHLAPWCMTTMGDDCLANVDLWCDLAHAIQLECTHCVSSRRGCARAPWITKNYIRVARQRRALFKHAARLQCPKTLAQAKALQRSG